MYEREEHWKNNAAFQRETEDVAKDSKPEDPDRIQRFELKHFSSWHKNQVTHLNECLDGKIPGWMIKQRTVLIQ